MQYDLDEGPEKMHELALTQSLIEIAQSAAGNNPVLLVRVQIGRFSSISADSLRFCFDACISGTNLEGAELQIEIPTAKGKCRDCENELELADPPWLCTCGSESISCLSGFELELKEIEIKQCA